MNRLAQLPLPPASQLLDLTSEQLAGAAQNGDQRALNALFEKHKHKAYRVALRMAGNPHDAEEILQLAFERVLKHLQSFDAARQFSPWLMRILINQAQTHLKKRTVTNWLLLRKTELPELPAGNSARADWHLGQKRIRQHIEHALARLPIAQRQIFVLKHIEEFSYDEIAAMTGDSVGSLKVRCHRARAALVQLLREANVTPDTVAE